jgi:Flp pilus assembly protein TadG
MIEFALTAPLLLLLVAGVLNYAMALRTAIAVSEAARVGAQYGSAGTPYSSDLAGMAAAARNAAPQLDGLTAEPAQSCRCAGGGAVSCGGSCGAAAMEVYVQVTTRATAPNWFRYAGLPFTGAVSATAVMRSK